MHIAIYHNLPSGGGKRALYEWTRRLAHEHEIDIYSLSTGNHEFCDLRPFVKTHKIYPFTLGKNWRKPFGRLDQLQRWFDLGNLERLSHSIAGEINQGKYDVVFVNTCIFTFIPAILQFITKPSIYYLHEPFGIIRKLDLFRRIDRPYFRRSNFRDWLDKNDPLIKLYQSRLNIIQKKSVKNTTQMLANSQYTKECMKTEFGLEFPVCQYGVNFDEFRRIDGIVKEHFVFSVGELSPRKGFDFLIRSIGRIPDIDRPSFKIACNTINTKDANKEANKEAIYLQNLATDHGVELQVLENQTTEDLMNLYNKAKMCVYSPVLEPFGLVPLEAMACGTPVVGVYEGGVKESVINEVTGLLTERNEMDFAGAIQKLLTNPGLADQLGRNGRNHVEKNWSWEKSTKNLEYFLSVNGNKDKK